MTTSGGSDGMEVFPFDEEGWKSHIREDVDRLQREVSRSSPRTVDEAMTATRDAARRDSDVAKFLRHTVWGQIAWYKELGKPLTPRMADAFEVVHMYEELEWTIGPGGEITPIGRTKEGARAQVWDGPNDEETYRVSYLLHGAEGWRNLLLVDLSPEVLWEPSGPGILKRARRISYPDHLWVSGDRQPRSPYFYVESEGITTLNDIRVVPFFT